jgi:hypothetical protein
MTLERNKDDLSSDAIRRRRVEIRAKALAKLVDFRPLEVAQNALGERIGALEGLNSRNSQQIKELQWLKQALGIF